MEEEIVRIERNRSKSLLLTLVCLVFVFIGVKMISGDIKTSRMSVEGAVAIGYIGIIFFGLGGLVIISNAFTVKPALKIHRDGVWNYTQIGGGYLVTWNNMKSLSIIKSGKQEMIKIEVKSADEIYEQVNTIGVFFMKLNSKFHGTPVFISSSFMKISANEALGLIRQHKKRFTQKTSIQ